MSWSAEHSATLSRSSVDHFPQRSPNSSKLKPKDLFLCESLHREPCGWVQTSPNSLPIASSPCRGLPLAGLHQVLDSGPWSTIASAVHAHNHFAPKSQVMGEVGSRHCCDLHYICCWLACAVLQPTQQAWSHWPTGKALGTEPHLLSTRHGFSWLDRGLSRRWP